MIYRRLKGCLSPFKIVMKMHSVVGLPAMTLLERKAYKKAILSLKSDKCINIFEYGTGFSTKYYAKFLKKKKKNFHIYSVDNSLEWHKKIGYMIKKEQLEDVVTLFVSEFQPFWEREGWDWNKVPECGQFAPKIESEKKYIELPLNLGTKFDFVSIDGRFRRRCLEVVPKCLNDNGIVFLHDAQNERYHRSFSSYKYSSILDSGKYYPFEKRNWKIWFGSNTNTIVENLDINGRIDCRE